MPVQLLHCRLLCIPVVLGLLVPLAIAQESGKGPPLRGIVVDEVGLPVEAVDVTVDWHGGRATTETGGNGQFELDVPYDLARGHYVRAADATGKRRAYISVPWSDEASELRLELQPARLVAISVADGAGKAIANVKVGILVDFQLLDDGTTDANGEVELWSPANAGITWVYALKKDEGFDYRAFLLPPEQEGDQLTKSPELDDAPVRLSLDGTQPLRVRLVETDGKPIPGLKIYPWLLMKPGETNDINLSYLPDDLVAATTDVDGWADWAWIPAWNEREITVWPRTDINGTEGVYARRRGSYDPKSGTGELTLALDRLVPISGRITFPDGSPAKEIAVQVAGASYDIDGFRGEALTDVDGRYQINAAPNMVYLVAVHDSRWASEPQTGFAVLPGQAVNNLDFELRPASRLFGRVTIGPQEEPVKGQQIVVQQFGQDMHSIEGMELPNPERSNRYVQPQISQFVATDDDGQYELFVGSGDFAIQGPTQSPTQKFTVSDQSELEFNFHSPREEKGILNGMVVAGDPPQGAPDAIVVGIYRHPLAGRDMRANTDVSGRFQVERELHRTVLHARSSDGKLAGVVQIEPDQEDVTITLKPLGRARGRLVDGDGQPLPDREIVYGVRVHEGDDDSPFRTCFGGKSVTDADGLFAVDGLVLSQDYEISVTIPADEDQQYPSWRNVGKITPADPSDVDLGDLKLKPIERPPTIEERIARTFHSPKTPLERFEAALQDALIAQQRVVVLFADAGDELAGELLKLRYENADLRQSMDWFQLLVVDTAESKRSDAKKLADRLSAVLNETSALPTLIIAETDGTPLASVNLHELAADSQIDEKKVSELLGLHIPDPLNAQTLLNEALTRAEEENKRVIIQETASWCGPCWLLSRFLENHKDQWTADYILVKMDHRWQGAQEIMQKYRGGAEGGLPWWAILDASGKVLITSNDAEGNNIGFPGDEGGQAHFREMLQSTAQRLSSEEITALTDALEDR